MDKIPNNLHTKRIVRQTPFGQRAADVALSRSMRGLRGLIPSTKGIQDVRIFSAAKKTADAVNAIETVHAAAHGPDPELSAYAQELLQDPRFLACLSHSLSEIQALIESAHPQGENDPNSEETADPNADPVDSFEKVARTEKMRGPDYEGVGPKAANEKDDPLRGGGMPGTDGLPNSFTVKDLQRALDARQFAPHSHLERNPGIGLDAATKAVAGMAFVPALDSRMWTPEAMKHYRALGLANGDIAAHLAQFGIEPMDSKGNTRPIPIDMMPDSAIKRYFQE